MNERTPKWPLLSSQLSPGVTNLLTGFGVTNTPYCHKGRY